MMRYQSRRSAPTMSAACCAPRRSRRRAPSASKGEISGGAAQGDRGSRDRGDHQEAGRGRAEGDHRRRIPPRVLESTISSGSSTASRPISASARSAFQGMQPKPMMLRVTGKLGGYGPHPMIEHFKFVQSHTKADAEDDDPVAVVAALPLRPRRGAGGDLSRRWTISTPISAPPTARRCAPSPTPAAAICSSTRSISRYLCDPELRKQVTQRGDDPEQLPADLRRRMINAAISDIPADMTITMHLCRGNFQSTFVASGGYEPVAEILFNTIKVNGYFMEYDTERAGGFEPLRFVPKDKTVVLGLVTSKSGDARKQGRAQAPHRRGGEVCEPRSALPVAAMRLRLDRGRQHPHRGAAMGEAADDRRTVGRSWGR